MSDLVLDKDGVKSVLGTALCHHEAFEVRLSWYLFVWCTRTRPSMSIKCSDSGIQVGSALQTGTIYLLALAADENFIYAVATTFGASFFCRKKQQTTKFTYSLLKSSVYFMSNILNMPNSNDMHSFLSFYEKKYLVDGILEMFCSDVVK